MMSEVVHDSANRAKINRNHDQISQNSFNGYDGN